MLGWGLYKSPQDIFIVQYVYITCTYADLAAQNNQKTMTKRDTPSPPSQATFGFFIKKNQKDIITTFLFISIRDPRTQISFAHVLLPFFLRNQSALPSSSSSSSFFVLINPFSPSSSSSSRNDSITTRF